MTTPDDQADHEDNMRLDESDVIVVVNTDGPREVRVPDVPLSTEVLP